MAARKPTPPPPRRRRTTPGVYLDAGALEIVDAKVVWKDAIELAKTCAGLAAENAVKLRDQVAKARKEGEAQGLWDFVKGLEKMLEREQRLVSFDDVTPTVAMPIPEAAKRGGRK